MPEFAKEEADVLLLRELDGMQEESEIREISRILFDAYSSNYALASKEVEDAISLIKTLSDGYHDLGDIERILNAKRFVLNLKKNKDMDGKRISGYTRETVELFKSLYGAKPKSGRITEFVMSALVPQPQRRHPGVDDSIHTSLQMDHDHVELINIMRSTHKELLKTRKSNLAPVPLISQVNLADDPVLAYLTGEEKSLLSTYADSIAAERQKDIVFHIAGHGGPMGIGSVSPEHRLESDVLADMIHRMISSAGLEEKFTGKKAHKLKIVLHSCNSAYCDITSPTDEDAIRESISKFSYIGRLYKELSEEYGFGNVEVVGFRGFYVPISSAGGGVRLLKSLDDTVGKSLESGTYSISKDGVAIPTSVATMLDIELPDYQVAEFHREMERIISGDTGDILTDISAGAGIRFSTASADTAARAVADDLAGPASTVEVADRRRRVDD